MTVQKHSSRVRFPLKTKMFGAGTMIVDRFRQAQMEKERERDGDGEGGGKMHAHKYSCLTTKQVMN